MHSTQGLEVLAGGCVALCQTDVKATQPTYNTAAAGAPGNQEQQLTEEGHVHIRSGCSLQRRLNSCSQSTHFHADCVYEQLQTNCSVGNLLFDGAVLLQVSRDR